MSSTVQYSCHSAILNFFFNFQCSRSSFCTISLQNEFNILKCFPVAGGNIQSDGQTDTVQSYSPSTGNI